jgi:hypothetical protein
VVYRLNKQNAASANDGGKAGGLGGETKLRRVYVRNKEGRLAGVVHMKGSGDNAKDEQKAAPLITNDLQQKSRYEADL